MSEERLDAVGIGSMVVDRVHRSPRLLGSEQKGILRAMADGGPVEIHVGGVVLNHLGWGAALGLNTGIFGRQADDENGRFLRAAMDRAGIARNIELDGSATSVAEIFVDDKGGRAIYMAPGATSETTPTKIRADHAEFIRRGARLTTEVSQLPLDAALAALEIARAGGIPTLVDLDVPPTDALATLGSETTLDAVLRAADVLKPAKLAAREIVPHAGSDALAIARAMRDRYGNAAVVVTDGEAGCAIATDGFEGFVPARSVAAVDTTGAGDAFVGGLLVGLKHELDWEVIGQLANAAGAACVEKIGAFPDDPAAARKRVLELYEGPDIELGPDRVVTDEGSSPSHGAGGPAVACFDIALEELAVLRSRIDAGSFHAAIALVRGAETVGGRVHVTGLGKPEHVAHYAASLLSSTGTPATFLHTTEAVHGSAGQVVSGDVVIAISNSGETREIRDTVQTVRKMGAKIIAVTGNVDSWLGRESDAVLDAGVAREGGPLNLAPRASVAAEVLVIAGLSAALQHQRGFQRADYQLRHPSGKLGERTRD